MLRIISTVICRQAHSLHRATKMVFLGILFEVRCGLMRWACYCFLKSFKFKLKISFFNGYIKWLMKDASNMAFFKKNIYFCLCWVFAVHWAFSSCGKQRLVSSYDVWASHHGGFLCCGAWALGCRLQWLWSMGLVALWHVESSWTWDWTLVPCIGRQILNNVHACVCVCARMHVPAQLLSCSVVSDSLWLHGL